MNTDALVIDAFAHLGIEARFLVGAPGGRVDVLLDPNGINSPIKIKHRSLVTEDVAELLLAELNTGATLLVVGDRVTDAARKVLTEHRGGYLDQRGRLALRTASLVIDAEVPPTTERPARTNALAGKAGLEIATALLMQPDRPSGVRALARGLGRSPSTVSEVLAALRQDGLTNETNTVVGTDLFWQVADLWPTKRFLLSHLPSPDVATLTKPLRLELEDVEHESGWALTDSAAAAAYGAPLAFRSGQLVDFFVPDRSIIRRATNLLGEATSLPQAQATVRVAPVPAVVKHRVDLDTSASHWPLAHPLFVALDLAQDVGRGREILEAWTPDGPWIRVW